MGNSSRSYYNREDSVGGQIRAKSDRKANERAQEYNRALVTVNQKKKEEELQQGMVAQLMMQQQTQLQMQKLQDLAAGLDLQTRMIDNKITAMQQPQPIPFGPEALPQVNVQGGLPVDLAAMQQQGMPQEGQGIPMGSGMPPMEQMPQQGMPQEGQDPNATMPPPFV